MVTSKEGNVIDLASHWTRLDFDDVARHQLIGIDLPN